MIESFNLSRLLSERSAQASFHVASGAHVRIEFRNMQAGEALGPLTYQGELVATCYRGAFRIEAEPTTVQLDVMDQAVVPLGTRIRIACELAGTLQCIWSPPFASSTRS